MVRGGAGRPGATTLLLASPAMTATADILDEYGDRASVCTVELRQYGGRRAFEGPISTVRCDEDNVRCERRLSEPGNGGSSSSTAEAPDAWPWRVRLVATLARDNGWAGLIIHGCVRDAAALPRVSIVGIKADRFVAARLRQSRARRGRCPGDVRRRHVPPGDMLFSDDDGVVTLGADGEQRSQAPSR